MNAGHPTDAALHRMIKRVLTTKGTTSDHLLILADWMDEAAAATPNTLAAVAILNRRAAELRHLAPMLAEPAPPDPKPGAGGLIYTYAGRGS
jgi:hypothetical protein